MIHRLGFYLDDWAALWVQHSLGASGLRDFAAYDRPYQGWLFAATAALLGEHAIRWHLFALLVRWLSAVAMAFALRAVWPARGREAAWIACLFLVYPGFTFQPQAWIYSQAGFVPLILSLVSLWATISAVRKPELLWPLTSVAIPASILSLMVTEYFVGLELLRPLLVWLVVGEQTADRRDRARRTLSVSLPYLIVIALYVIWRLFVFESARPSTDASTFIATFMAHPVQGLIGRFGGAIRDLVESGLLAWGQTVRSNVLAFDPYGWLLTLVGTSMSVLFLLGLERSAPFAVDPGTSQVRTWGRLAAGIGVVAMCLGALPLWFGARAIELDGAGNRFTLTTMSGACIFVVGLILIAIKTRVQQVVLVGVLIGLAVGFHFRNSRLYRDNWAEQRSLFWQLRWRAPALEPGTAVMMRESVSLPDDDALAAPLNFAFGPQQTSTRVDYWFFNLPPELLPVSSNQFILNVQGLTGESPLKRIHRSLVFEGAAANSLVVRFALPGCLRVLDPTRDRLPQLHPVEAAAQGVSNVDRIALEANRDPAAFSLVLGPEPEHGWCYYFQKGELARQGEDWPGVVRLADEAGRRGLRPADGTEWLPFIEGYARLGRYGDASQLARLAFDSVPNMESSLKVLLDRLARDTPVDPAREAFMAEATALRVNRTPCVNCFIGY
jgi:hypothetical protein